MIKTEAEWLNCESPAEMLDFLEGRITSRKLRLFSLSIWRKHPSYAYSVNLTEILALSERYADGEIGKEYFHEQAIRHGWDRQQIGLSQSSDTSFFIGVENASNWLSTQHGAKESKRQCGLLREIVGNPWKPIITVKQPFSKWMFGNGTRLDADLFSWNNRTIPEIAGEIYRERRWQDMPILADALEDAGLVNEAILNHCRGPGPHVRGCWVIDLLIGKE